MTLPEFKEGDDRLLITAVTNLLTPPAIVSYLLAHSQISNSQTNTNNQNAKDVVMTKWSKYCCTQCCNKEELADDVWEWFELVSNLLNNGIPDFDPISPKDAWDNYFRYLNLELHDNCYVDRIIISGGEYQIFPDSGMMSRRLCYEDPDEVAASIASIDSFSGIKQAIDLATKAPMTSPVDSSDPYEYRRRAGHVQLADIKRRDELTMAVMKLKQFAGSVRDIEDKMQIMKWDTLLLIVIADDGLNDIDNLDITKYKSHHLIDTYLRECDGNVGHTPDLQRLDGPNV
jgi:hypothetical protein